MGQIGPMNRALVVLTDQTPGPLFSPCGARSLPRILNDTSISAPGHVGRLGVHQPAPCGFIFGASSPATIKK